MPESFHAKALERPPSEEKDRPQQRVRIPGQVPLRFKEAVRDELTRFLVEEFYLAEAERTPFIKKLARWKVAYEAPVQTEPKHFPIFNSSNLVIPVIKEAVNTLTAQLIQGTMTARPRWVFKDLAPEWTPFVDEIERFMDLASDRDMRLDEQAIPWIIENSKLGTGLMQMTYEVDEVRTYRTTSDGKRVYPANIVRADGPSPRHIPLGKFWIRFNETDIQRAQWCATELDYTEFQLRRKASGGFFDPEATEIVLKAGARERSEPIDDAMDAIQETIPLNKNRFKIFQVWVSWDVDGDGTPEELLVHFEPSTRQILRMDFNPFDSGKRPFIKIVYFPVEDRFYGEGLCEMLEQIQLGISSIANKRADNATLANLKMIIKKKIVQGLKPGDPLYSGKIIEAPDPFRDIREFSLSDIYPSTVMEEQMLQKRGERLAGMNEGVAGAAMPVSRTTASAQLALLQEQAKRIDLTIRSIRDGFGEIGKMALDLYFQYGTLGKPIAWMGERGKIVEAVFSLPRARLDLGYGLKAQTPTSMQNQQVKRENKIALFNLLLQAHKELMPFAQAFAPNELPVLAQSMVEAARKYLGDVLETFEETDPEAVLAGLATLERILPRPEDLGGLESITAADSTAAILEKLGRLEDSLREARVAADRSLGIRAGSGNGSRVPPEEGIFGRSLPGIGFLPEPL